MPSIESDRPLIEAAPKRAGGRLYRNELESGELRFVDVTESSQLRALGYGMGVATGDYDNDGWVDLYLTNYGANQLWRNRGDGTFEDVTARTGTGDGDWSVAAVFADFDRDGWLDLYVGNYVDARPDNHQLCHAQSTAPTYCAPSRFTAQRDRLFFSREDGSFRDRSEWLTAFGPGLGAVAADFDGDGWLDLYVANDGTANHLWINRSGGGFVDQALMGGAALNGDGLPEASMGVAAADIDDDGDRDLLLTHLDRETNTLYVNDGAGMFDDRGAAFGLGAPSLRRTGFGAGWLDYDNDGDLDLMVVNGEVDSIEKLYRNGDAYPFAQPNQLFRRDDDRFVDVSTRVGPALQLSEISRGAAFGDVDNDGDVDVLISNNSGPVRLLLNQVGQTRAWLGLRLALASGRDAVGARVELQRAGASSWRWSDSGGSYASASDARVLFGLGEAAPDEVFQVVVQWPDGALERWRSLPAGRYTTLRAGGGEHMEP